MARTSPTLRSIRTRGDAARVFVAQPSPRIIIGALGAALVHRARTRRGGAGDLAAVAAVVLTRGLHEYAIHRWLLHAPRRELRGRRVDPGVGHRAHHADPDVLGDAFIPPARAAAFLVMLAAYVGAVVRVLRLPTSTARTATVAAWAALLAYEWRHFVDHTSVPLRSPRARALRTHHRSHHHVDERRDLGITSRAADRLVATGRRLATRSH
jgi:hypothetical protein